MLMKDALYVSERITHANAQINKRLPCVGLIIVMITERFCPHVNDPHRKYSAAVLRRSLTFNSAAFRVI
jgi:hypothetical protein